MSKNYLIQRSNQEYMQVNETLFLEKKQEHFIRAGALIWISKVTHLILHVKSGYNKLTSLSFAFRNSLCLVALTSLCLTSCSRV